MNMGFVILYVQDMEKSKTFYTEVLGMPVVEAISGPNFVALKPSGGSLVALQNRATAPIQPKEGTTPGAFELSFEAEDVDSVWKDWQSKGVEMVSQPEDMPFG